MKEKNVKDKYKDAIEILEVLIKIKEDKEGAAKSKKYQQGINLRTIEGKFISENLMKKFPDCTPEILGEKDVNILKMMVRKLKIELILDGSEPVMEFKFCEIIEADFFDNEWSGYGDVIEDGDITYDGGFTYGS